MTKQISRMSAGNLRSAAGGVDRGGECGQELSYMRQFRPSFVSLPRGAQIDSPVEKKVDKGPPFWKDFTSLVDNRYIPNPLMITKGWVGQSD
ncbi:MAG: hypothetical protein M1541_13470 [Acidobacteria bacterium]|nr:hypothetical protein [Acidobacteriota bacterium]